MPFPFVTTVKRARNASTIPAKRRKTTARGTESQPVDVDASQLVQNDATFESQLRESQPENAIAAPTEDGSEVAAASENPDNTEDDTDSGGFDDSALDTFDGIDWARLPLLHANRVILTSTYSTHIYSSLRS
jgi:hypothetical protein